MAVTRGLSPTSVGSARHEKSHQKTRGAGPAELRDTIAHTYVNTYVKHAGGHEVLEQATNMDSQSSRLSFVFIQSASSL